MGRTIFFMHIAKTAGSSVNRLMMPLYPGRAVDHVEGKNDWHWQIDSYDYISGHLRFDHIINAMDGRSHFLFTVLRDPIDHLQSHLNWIRIQTVQPRFAAFVEKYPKIGALSAGLNEIDMRDPEAIRHFLDRRGSALDALQYFDNCQCRYFNAGSSTRKLKMLDFLDAYNRFSVMQFVGTSEDFEVSMGRLFARLDIEAPSLLPKENAENYQKATDREGFRRALAPYIAFDMALYDLAMAA